MLEDAIDVSCCLSELVGYVDAGAVIHQAAVLRETLICGDRRQAMAGRQVDDQAAAQIGEAVSGQDQAAVRRACETLESGFDVGGCANRDDNSLHTPCDGAAASIERMKNLDYGDVSGLNMTPTRARPGAISLSSSSHLPPTENSNMLNPVRLPPGRVTFVTKPCSTGSETCTNTTGTVLVACWITVSWSWRRPGSRRVSDRSTAHPVGPNCLSETVSGKAKGRPPQEGRHPRCRPRARAHPLTTGDCTRAAPASTHTVRTAPEEPWHRSNPNLDNPP